jgi:glycosyltransferase involved in cell wall biosynthesis
MRDSQDLLEPILSARGIDIIPVDLGNWSLAAVPKVLKAIARQRPDGILMQYPTFAFGKSLGPPVLSMLQQIAPNLVMLHEFVAAHPLRKAAVGVLLLGADRIGVTAEREANGLVSWYPWLRQRIRSIPIASNIPGRSWHPTKPARVIYFGQLRPNKGIEDFFTCRDRIAAQVPEAIFEIVGARVPGLESYTKMVLDNAASRGITLTLDREPLEVSAILSAATVALLPFPGGSSLRRGSLLAAAACGIPIVTTTGDDTPALLRHHVEPARDDDALVAITVNYLRNEEARLEAHRRSMQLDRQIGWELTAERYIDVLRELPSIHRARASRTSASNMAQLTKVH